MMKMKMKIILLSVLALSLIASAGTAAAKPHWKQDDQICKAHAKGLENALKHVKNKKAREAIKEAMERQKQYCEDESDSVVKTDWQIVTSDKAALTIGYGSGDNAYHVTSPLRLSTIGKYGSTISWVSSNPSVISHDGKTVNRPLSVNGDARVTLTATITKNNASVTKQFTVIVKSFVNDAARVAADKAALAIGYVEGDSAGSVTSKLTLPATGPNGSAITWVSSAPHLISNDGKTVNRPSSTQGDATVTLIATIKSGTISDVKLFSVVVKRQLTDAEKVAADKAALAIGYAEGDSASSVTSKLTLPATGPNGSTIAWVSSAPHLISNDGKTINRPEYGKGDQQVTLIATITSNNIADIRSFTVVVKQQLTDAQKVAADKAALKIGFSSGNSASYVTANLDLTNTGVNGSAIYWSSSDTTYISNSGRVTRPAAGTGDKQIALTAIIISNAVVDAKTFTVTVKQLPY